LLKFDDLMKKFKIGKETKEKAISLKPEMKGRLEK
jgi:hypothetical protein